MDSCLSVLPKPVTASSWALTLSGNAEAGHTRSTMKLTILSVGKGISEKRSFLLLYL